MEDSGSSPSNTNSSITVINHTFKSTIPVNFEESDTSVWNSDCDTISRQMDSRSLFLSTGERINYDKEQIKKIIDIYDDTYTKNFENYGNSSEDYDYTRRLKINKKKEIKDSYPDEDNDIFVQNLIKLLDRINAVENDVNKKKSRTYESMEFTISRTKQLILHFLGIYKPNEYNEEPEYISDKKKGGKTKKNKNKKRKTKKQKEKNKKTKREKQKNKKRKTKKRL